MNRLFERLKKNTLTQLFTLMIIMGLSALLSNWFEWLYPVAVVASIILAFYVIVFIIAGVVNAIKDGLK
jgi:hypothetical protein